MEFQSAFRACLMPRRYPAGSDKYGVSDHRGERKSVGTVYRLQQERNRAQRKCGGMSYAQGCLPDVRIMKEIFSILPPWFYILLAVGLLDALFQWTDYREWRRERRESEEVNK